MIYLTPESTNYLRVTWTQRASTGDRFVMRLTNLAKNTYTDYTFLKSANLSNYTGRFDKFPITVQSIDNGSYRYEVYDTNSTVAAALAVVETGLAFVQTAVQGYNKLTNTITYNVYEPTGGIFDYTFDLTFA